MKNELRKATYKLFSERGYNLSLTEVANMVGIKKPSIYNHYKNKDELICAVVYDEIENFFSHQELSMEINKKLDNNIRLKKIYFELLSYFSDYSKLKFWRQLILVNNELLMNRFRDNIREHENIFYTHVYNIIQDILSAHNQNEETARALLLTMVALIQGTMDGMLLYKDTFDTSVLIDSVWNIFWQAVTANIES